MNTELLTALRELHSRVGDGLHVRLLWDPRDDTTLVTVVDAKNGSSFHVEVLPGERPLDVFHHPFAYAAYRGISAGAADRSPVAV